MTIDYVFTKRLSLIKYFYNLALTQSNRPTPQNSISVLMFHDCVELFLILAAEKVGATIRDKMFILDYWNAINQNLGADKLSQKASIKRLNEARKTFKHKGILIEEGEIESFRITTKLFLDENIPLIFNMNFDEISMIDLIENQNVKKILKDSQDLLMKEKFKEAIEHIAVAYKVLILDYETSKEMFGMSIFDVLGWRFKSIGRFDLKKDEEGIVEALENINIALKPLFLGIDYRKYLKFYILTPDRVAFIGRYPEGGIDLTEDYIEKFRIIWSRKRDKQEFIKEDVLYCFDFIIETTLKLQEFDFSLNV